MAVYTLVSTQELTQYLTRFDLGALLSHAEISDGVENTNYVIMTEKGKYILTLFEGRVREEAIPFCLEFMAHLNKQSIPVSTVVADKNGEMIMPLKGKKSVLTRFLEGSGLKDPTPAQCRLMGKTLAHMHLAGQDFALAHENTMALLEWRWLITASGDKAEEIEAGLADFLRAELDFLEAHMPCALPRGAIHADVFPDNVLFAGEKISGVIDFYFSCTDFLAYDLMLTFNAWCFGGGDVPEAENAAEFLDGYSSVRVLTPEERASLPFFGRAAALRIIATRLFDAAHPKPQALVTPKDPLEYLQILRFHRGSFA
jgi:homoserine kinase type II